MALTGRDRYGRTVAPLAVGGQDVCFALVQAGSSWHDGHVYGLRLPAVAGNRAEAQQGVLNLTCTRGVSPGGALAAARRQQSIANEAARQRHTATDDNAMTQVVEWHVGHWLLSVVALSLTRHLHQHGREIEGFVVIAQQQGTKAVLAILNKQTATSAATLMRNMYRYNQELDVIRIEALRQTQMTLQDQRQTAYRPYRSPFTLIGSWQL